MRRTHSESRTCMHVRKRQFLSKEPDLFPTAERHNVESTKFDLKEIEQINTEQMIEECFMEGWSKGEAPLLRLRWGRSVSQSSGHRSSDNQHNQKRRRNDRAGPYLHHRHCPLSVSPSLLPVAFELPLCERMEKRGETKDCLQQSRSSVPWSRAGPLIKDGY